MLELADHWVWDSWTVHDGQRHHLFFLRASRALQDPDRRHVRASIGHASSTDLREWTLHPDALVPGDEPAWDDLATWTGSVVADPAGGWTMFYTGVSRADAGLVQRIGAAHSTDLMTWTRGALVLEADARWYEVLDPDSWYDESWRDPFVFLGEDRRWHMLITARAKEGDPAGRGVVGHASSDDLRAWTVHEPLTAPMGFGQVEVCQVQTVDGQPTLVFSCRSSHMSAEAVQRLAPGHRGTWTLQGDSLLGPWDPGSLRAHPRSDLYAARLVRDASGWSLLGFEDSGEPGGFVGRILDPVPFE